MDLDLFLILTLFSWYFVSSHAHKNTVMEVKLNLNGNWLLTASRDHLCKLFDIRNLKEELQVFRGHKKEATGQWLLETLHLLTCLWCSEVLIILPFPVFLFYSCGLASCSWRTFCQWRVWWLFALLACWVCNTYYKEVAYCLKRAPESIKHDTVCMFAQCSYVLCQRLSAAFHSGNPAWNRKLSTFIFGCRSH